MSGLPHGRQRARSVSEKALRRAELLNAAETLLQRGGYEAATMSAIAVHAGISKPSAYLYFATKEALFLTLLTERLQAWFEHIGSRLNGPDRVTDEELVRTIAVSLAERLTLRNLLVLLHGTLEQDVSVEEAWAFKRAMADGMRQLGGRIEDALLLPAGSGTRFLMLVHALCLGLTQIAAPSAVVRKAFEKDVALSLFEIDFGRSLEAALADILRAAR